MTHPIIVDDKNEYFLDDTLNIEFEKDLGLRAYVIRGYTTSGLSFQLNFDETAIERGRKLRIPISIPKITDNQASGILVARKK